MKNREVLVVGAGLVGSLLSIFLANRGYRVRVYERRPDQRKPGNTGGRSINLALSDRGLLALERAGISYQLSNLMIPMNGRSIHHLNGEQSFQPYGKKGQAINSISRVLLNALLIKTAEQAGVEFHFDQACEEVDFERSGIVIQNKDGRSTLVTGDLVVGADGAFSVIRGSMQKAENFNYDRTDMQHGYKELTIPRTRRDGFSLNENALHIWPRERFMLIALPNTDHTFTCTLFLPFAGPNSFAAISTHQELQSFFSRFFPDAQRLLPNLKQEFFQNPISTLLTIQCSPWTRNRTFLIGDACHAIVPFYGQGMNAGFEDCRVLDELVKNYNHDWSSILSNYDAQRKPNADAIGELALQNFVEMMDLVADPYFLLRKKIEAHLHDLFPERWIPQYSMVTFSHVPYSEALIEGEKKSRVMDEIMSIPGIESKWLDLDFEPWIVQLETQ